MGTTVTRRKRRSADEKIQDLKAEIARLEARKLIKKSAARQKARAAMKALERAMPLAQAEQDRELERALGQAASLLGDCIEAGGGGGTRVRRSAEELEALGGEVVGYLVNNPKVSISVIAEAVGESTKDVRPVLLGLLEDGLVKKEGERRGTRYSATQKGRKQA